MKKSRMPQYKGIQALYVTLSCISLLQSICILFQATLLAHIISDLFHGTPVEDLYLDLACFLLAFLSRGVLTWVRQKVSYRFAEKTGAETRRRLLDKLFELGPSFARSEGTGKLVTLALEGIAQLRIFLELYPPRMVSTAVLPLVIAGYVFFQDAISGVILVVTVPIIIIFMILLGLAAQKQMDKQWHSYRILSNHFVDTLRGLETLKFLGHSRRHQVSIARVSDQYRSATVRTLRVAFLSSFALDFFTSLSVACVAVGLGLRLVEGSMALAPALTVLILAPEYFLPVREVGSDYHATLNGRTAADNIQAILNYDTVQAAAELDRSSSWGPDSSLSLHGVDVRHQQEAAYSLHNVSFEIKGTMKVGIVGESGAGKSTLIDVLGGFLHPSNGRIHWNEPELQSLVMEQWHKQTTYIPQHPYIFNDTLAENIRFYVPDASMDAVTRAAAAAGLAELAASLPHQYEETIGNGGRTLSGGQEQRVALARAFLSDRPVVLLDEPTAHLDIETEYELKQTMLRLFEDKLVFLATHRLHWMLHMDQIIVLDQGRVAEIGTHESLIRQKGVYYELIRSQKEGIR
ncbi:thiol reductant ABC exporter subunit CydD [Paenibacillus profundus]|uniref:Thiol reductant ABC exporter subunit CydD n=1 Tax=Paenibacillus profundus TaxID=1173085 RepID=A0ABS8YMU4_9BACL|nr:thiol reductant ABC exporter subunit CydD [Paenibacillus profundus]MCE5173135.1 thiol reductant ABC exporter subunit CydD [Paenibacillus profundus]